MEIEWPLHNQYYEGTVETANFGRYHSLYDDGDLQSLQLASESWRLPDSNVNGMSVFSGLNLESNE